ncbi:MAG TPA: ROK family transcriptional regulator [Firmicutes bacterium]|nr:ROK family transcriptional regulator [Candidatus Fermentithermobacillaceae bacterium]
MDPSREGATHETILSGLDDSALWILGNIQKHGPITITSLMEITQKPRTTLNRSIRELLDHGLIKQEGLETSTGGRPSAIFRINEDGFYTVGVELSHTNIHVLICDALLEPLWIADFAIMDKSTPDEVFSRLFEALESNLAEVVSDRRRLLGLGIGSVGPLDLERGVMLNASSFPNPGWRNLGLRSIFEDRFHVPVYIANGASAAAMCEYVHYVTSDVHNLIFLNVGVSVRCGVISGDTLLTGDGDREGAYGHLIIVPGGRPCYCGKHGCVEAYATAPAIVRAFKHEIRIGKASSLVGAKSLDKIQFADICDAARNNDGVAIEVLRDAATYMGLVMANIINVLNPQVIVLGGTVPDRFPDYFDWAVQTAQKMIYNSEQVKCQFTTPLMGHNTIAAGAAAMVLLSAMKVKSLW